jgi:hypothetical protein
MSKRNFILLIIILLIAGTAIFGFFYFRGTNSTTPGTIDSGINFISQFNPFGASTKPGDTTSPVDVSGYQPAATGERTKLTKISSMPIAGYTVFAKEKLKEGGTEFMPFLRYVEKSTGNIYQTFAGEIIEKKFSGTIIPRVWDSYFGNNGESVVMRYLKTDNATIETFVGALPKEYLGTDPNSINEVKGSFLPSNIKDISLSPNGTKIFYLFNSGDSAIGTTLDLLNNKKVQIFDSPFTEWLSWWGSNNTITLSTKPSANVPGFVYAIDDTGKNLTKILGNINGLTALGSPDGKLILYGNNNLSLSIYHADTRNSDSLGIKTLPEKCVWGKLSDIIYCAVPKSFELGQYPDSWYQGEVSFNDQFWRIDVKTGNSTLLLNPVTVATEEVDGIKLTLDADENYLFFVNKKDSFLWELDIK